MKSETNWLAWLLSLMLATAVVTRTPARPLGSAATEAKAAVVTEPRAVEAESPAAAAGLALLGEFGGDRRAPGIKAPEGHRLDGMIATVHDPLGSAVGWRFDAHLEAIQRAFEASGYLLDRHRLPWARPAAEAKAGGDAARQPGIVLFRRKTELFLLFLVPESPIGGVSQPALLQALDVLHEAGVPPPVRILGPTFSGAAASLRRGLEGWCARCREACAPAAGGPAFRVISGSATDPGNKKAIEGDSNSKPVVSFQATVRPDDAMESALGWYFERAGIRGDEVAVLSEANSGYGRQKLGESGAPESAPRCDRHPGCWLRIPFPIHISQVRGASAKRKGGEEAESSRDPLGRARQPAIELALDDHVRPSDAIAPIAPRLAAPIGELQLANLLSTLTAEGIRYVGILASDSRDTLFLARQVRKYAGDVRLFTFESDALYLHPEYGSALNGMLVATTYPLIAYGLATPAHQPIGGRLFFPSNGAAGAYNAALALLHGGESKQIADLLVDYAPPSVERAAGRVAGKTERSLPPVWLVVTGDGRFLPVAADAEGTGKDESNYVWRPESPPHPLELGVDVEKSTAIPFASAGLVLLALSIGYLWVGRGLGGQWSYRPRALALFVSVGADSPGRYLAVGYATLFLAWLYAAFHLVLPMRLSASARGASAAAWSALLPLVLLSAATAGALAAATAAALVRAVPRIATRRRAKHAAVATGLVVSAVHLGVTALAPSLGLDATAAALRLERVGSTAGGVSPLVPVFFLVFGMLVVVAGHLERLRLLVPLGALTAIGSWPTPAAAGLHDRELRLRRTFGSAIPGSRGADGWLVVASVSIWLLACVWLRGRHIPAFDDPPFELASAVIFAALVLAVVFAVLHLAIAWRKTDGWLGQFAALLGDGSFPRLPQRLLDLASPFRAGAPRLHDLAWHVNRLGELTRRRSELERGEAGLPDEEDLHSLVDRLPGLFAEEQLEAKRGGHSPPADVTWTRAALGVGAGTIARWLEIPVRTPPPEGSRAWRELALELVAADALFFLDRVFDQLRNLIVLALGASFTLLLATASYPFEPGQLLVLFCWLLLAVAVAAAFVVLTQMNRDETVSWLQHTAPNQISILDRGFLASALRYGLLPLLAAAATQVPGLSGLSAIVEQTARLLK